MNVSIAGNRQEIFRFLRNPNVYYIVGKSPPLFPVLIQVNPEGDGGVAFNACVRQVG
jgi:hypothetical protein